MRGDGQAAFEKYSVSGPERALLSAAADDVVSKAARRTSPIHRYYKIRRKKPLLWGYVAAGAAAVMPLIGAMAIFAHADLAETKTYPLIAAAATLSGVSAAALGQLDSASKRPRAAYAEHPRDALFQRVVW